MRKIALITDLAIIVPRIWRKVSKIKDIRPNQQTLIMLESKNILPLKAKWAAFIRKATRTNQHINCKLCHIKAHPQMV